MIYLTIEKNKKACKLKIHEKDIHNKDYIFRLLVQGVNAINKELKK